MNWIKHHVSLTQNGTILWRLIKKKETKDQNPCLFLLASSQSQKSFNCLRSFKFIKEFKFVGFHVRLLGSCENLWAFFFFLVHVIQVYKKSTNDEKMEQMNIFRKVIFISWFSEMQTKFRYDAYKF